MSGAALAAAAEALVGTRFRLHGRDPATGLDCIGLLSAALAATGRGAPLPNGYPLRARSLEALLPDPTACGFARVTGAIVPGDVAMLYVGPAQFHLVIGARDGGYVHAHAGLRRVVHSPGLLPGTVAGHWRPTS